MTEMNIFNRRKTTGRKYHEHLGMCVTYFRTEPPGFKPRLANRFMPHLVPEIYGIKK
jgi:hypothetical protein